MHNNFYKNDISEIISGIRDCKKKLKNQKILLVGANGFLGKYFTEVFKELIDKDKIKFKLDCYDNFISSKNNPDIPKNHNYIKFYKKDISKIIIKKKYDKIIFLAGIASPFIYKKYPLETLSVSYNGLENLLKHSLKYKTELVFFSSSEIYGNPDKKNIPTKEVYRGNVSTLGPRACYDESKRLGETLCYIYNNKYNLDINIIRPFNVYGPGMKQKDYRIFPNFISNILNNKKINIYGTGKQTRTYCYITDAIEGFIRVLCYGKKGEVYNIGNTDPEISVSQIFKVLNKIHNKKILSKFIKHPKSYPSDEPQRRCPDLTKAKTHLNYKPKVKLEDGLINFLNWAKIHYKY